MTGRIIIGADIVPTALNTDRFIAGDKTALIGEELSEIFDRADYRVFNLEVPLTDKGAPILKSGPNLIAPKATVFGYKALGIDALSVANNHTLDQGRDAFLETLDLLCENGIAPFGGGRTEEEVKKPLVLPLCKKMVGIVSFCEHEFSWYEDYGVGARGFDPLCSLDEITELSSEVDYLVVMYHGGREHFRYPSPNLQRVCRRMVDHGADLVLCQHSHCVGAGEIYKGAEIVYGQGNALFVYEKRSDECWFTGTVLELTCEDGRFRTKHYPIERHGVGVRLSHNPEILEGYKRRSAEIAEDGFVKRHYKEFVGQNASVAIEHLSRLGEALSNVGKKESAAARNLLTCDPHRELLIEYLVKINELY